MRLVCVRPSPRLCMKRECRHSQTSAAHRHTHYTLQAHNNVACKRKCPYTHALRPRKARSSPVARTGTRTQKIHTHKHTTRHRPLHNVAQHCSSVHLRHYGPLLIPRAHYRQLGEGMCMCVCGCGCVCGGGGGGVSCLRFGVSPALEVWNWAAETQESTQTTLGMSEERTHAHTRTHARPRTDTYAHAHTE